MFKHITIAFLVSFALFVACDTGTSPAEGNSTDTLYIATHDTLHSYDTVWAYDTTRIVVDTLLISDTAFLVLDSSVQREDAVQYVPVDTSVFYLPGTDTGIVLSWWDLELQADLFASFTLRGVIFNNTPDTLTNLRVVLDFYRSDMTHVFTVKARVFFPKYVENVSLWNKIPAGWFGEFDFRVKDLLAEHIVSSTACIKYQSISNFPDFVISSSCTENEFTYDELIQSGAMTVMASFEHD